MSIYKIMGKTVQEMKINITVLLQKQSLWPKMKKDELSCFVPIV